MEEFDFQIPDDARELLDSPQIPPDYDIPASAISDFDLGQAEQADPTELEPITAPDDYGADDDLADWDAALAEFSGDGTALDMPEAERTEAMAEIERFAAAGDEQVGKYKIHAVPKESLEAEGLDYDVEAVFQEPDDETPYATGLTATRTIAAEVQARDADGELMGLRAVEGQEKKTVTFVRIAESGTQSMADGELLSSVGGSYVREDAPLLRLDELRGIMRAIRRANGA